MVRSAIVGALLSCVAGCASVDDPGVAGTRCDRGLCIDDAPPVDVARCFVPLDETRASYAERLRGLWLAENVANWTGLLTEFQRKRAPFYTDADWGTPQGRWEIEGTAMGRITLNFLDPWGSDDDTDVEMIYLEAMREADTAHLTAAQIRDAWRTHIVPDRYVWVSNRAARRLFEEPIEVLPPSTGLLAANDQSLMIDAQLTTEIPDGSKTADVVDLVVTLHAESRDGDDWERARDELARVLQSEADARMGIATSSGTRRR